MKDIIKFVFKSAVVITIALLIFIIMISLFGSASDKQAEVECLKLRAQAEDYPTFFLVEWQKEMCDYVNINVDAPVRSINN